MAMQMSAQAAIAMVLFAIVSVLVGSTLSGAGGWRALARRYPGPGDTSPEPVRFRFASMRTSGGLIGSASFANCVTVEVGERGISLALLPGFRFRHPPIFLPWDAVEQCQTVEAYLHRVTLLTVRGGEALTFFGRLGTEVVRRAEAQGVPTRPLGPELPIK
jgi:hypothetical protein